MDVTSAKQWIHFLLSDRCPPTSTILRKRAFVIFFRTAISPASPFLRTDQQAAAGLVSAIDRFLPESGITILKFVLNDTRGGYSRSENILLRGNVFLRPYPIKVLKVTVNMHKRHVIT
jgi:hypothetical protein